MSDSNGVTASNLGSMSSMLLAAASLADRDRSTSLSTTSDRSSLDQSKECPEQKPEIQLSEYEWLLRFEAVRSRMGTFVLSRQTIMEHLRHVDADVDAAVDSLERAHHRAYTRTRGQSAEDLELPDRVRNIPISYFQTGEQERRQAADIFFLLVAQLNATREAGTAINLARSEAVLILDAESFDFEEALRLVQHRELAAQLLHIRFDDLRTLSGSEERRQEQEDAALVYFLTLTDRADMHTLQLHLTRHGGDLVAAIADWQKKGVTPVQHPKDQGQKQSDKWIGRRSMIQEDGHEMVLRPVPTNVETVEYNARTLGGRQEPHCFGLASNEIGARVKGLVFRESPTDRNNRPYSYILNHDRVGLAENCPNPRKFLIEYVEQGKYRVNGYDVMNSNMKKRTSRYFWKGAGLENTENKPVFDVNDPAHRLHFNNMYRQGYCRPTGTTSREQAVDWSDAEVERLWQLFAELYEEFVEAARKAGKPVNLSFFVKDPAKKHMAEEIEKVAGEKRSTNSIVTMAKRTRQICKDFVQTFDSSNEVIRQEASYRQLREGQIDRIAKALEDEGTSLSAEEILAALERISGGFQPFRWDTYMHVDACAPTRQLPSIGLPAINFGELQDEVALALADKPSDATDTQVWERAAQAARSYYRSDAGTKEFAAIQPLLDRLGLSTLSLNSWPEEEGLAVFEGLLEKHQRKQGQDQVQRLNQLVATSTLKLGTTPASMPSGGQVDQQDVGSFGVGLPSNHGDGWLTDQAIEAGIQTLSLQNTTVVNMHVARLFLDDPTNNPLPTINTAAENIAVVMHFGNHWTLGIYNTSARQYHLLDSMPIGPARFREMARRMDAIVAHYFPSHRQATWATTRSFEQDNGRDCGLYVIENLKSMDQGLPLHSVDGIDARIRVLSEIVRLADQGRSQAPAADETSDKSGEIWDSRGKVVEGGRVWVPDLGSRLLSSRERAQF